MSESTETAIAGIIVEQGKILDFIDSHTQRKDTPEEYVRQEIAKSLVREYRYPKDCIKVEYTLRMGTRKPRADLVVFPPFQEHVQQNATMILECKASTVKPTDKKDGVDQLQSYMAACPNVAYGMWTNGIERFCYRRLVQNGKVEFEETPDIPEFGMGAEEAERPRFDQLKPATSDALLFAFRRCHNYIAGNQGLQKPQAFWELLKLIFCKIHDERHNDDVEFFASATERHGVNGPLKVSKRIEGLFSQVKKDFSSIFRATDAIDLKPVVLAYLVAQLQMYSLLESDIDVKGRAYEEIVGSNLRGDRGEFFTPRNICRMAVEMLDPSEKNVIIDPACGTGGFLITAMNHVIDKILKAELAKWGNKVERAEKAARERIKRYAEQSIIGMDFNPELVKAAKMNMVMNNDGEGGLFQANSLESPTLWDKALRDRDIFGKADLLFTNPPFGSKIRVADSAILELYDLGRTSKAGVCRAQPPEILFVERCVRLVKPGTGRVAIVLPDGVLGSPGLGYVRDWILRHTRILASIDLHPDTFEPFVGVQTSVLVLQRKTEQQIAVETAAGRINDYPIFMAVANHIGHDKRGNATYVRDRHGNEVVEEAEVTVKDWQEGMPIYRKETRQQKVRDDNTLLIAQEFRQWLTEQD